MGTWTVTLVSRAVRRLQVGVPALAACILSAALCISCEKVLGLDEYTTFVPPCPQTQAPDPSGKCVTVGVLGSGAAWPSGFAYDGNGGWMFQAPACDSEYRFTTPSNNCQTLDCSRTPPIGISAFIDRQYSGDSYGTSDKPWKRIQDAVANTADGQVLYVRGAPDGSLVVYPETVDLGARSLVGPCRAYVEIHGGPDAPVVTLRPSTGLVPTLKNVSIWGGTTGVSVVGAGTAQLSGLLIHDVSGPGVAVRGASVSIADTAVRRVTGTGVLVASTQKDLSGASVTLSGSLVDTVHPVAESSNGVTSSFGGWCVAALGASGWPWPPSLPRPSLAVVGSVLTNCYERGVYGSGAAVSVEDSWISGVRSNADGLLGRGIEAEPFQDNAASVTVTATLIEGTPDVGVSLSDVESAVLDRVTIRGTSGRRAAVSSSAAPCPESGIGIRAQGGSVPCGTDAGVNGAAPEAGAACPQGNLRPSSTLTVTNSLIDGSRMEGVELSGVDATFSHSIIRGTETTDPPECPSAFGDAIAVYAMGGAPVGLHMGTMRIEASGRAALAAFGVDGRIDVQSAALVCDGYGLVSADGASVPISLPHPELVACSCGSVGAHPCGEEDRSLGPSLSGAP